MTSSQPFDFLKDSEFLANRENRRHCVFRNLKLNPPTWDDILGCLNKDVVSNEKIKTLDNLGFVYYNADRMSEVSKLLKEIQTLTDRQCSAHCYISLLEISGTFGRHNDSSDVFFWQVQGRTHWTVEQEKTYEYELLPNDLIYIPRFIFHTVRPLSPRAGISFGIDY